MRSHVGTLLGGTALAVAAAAHGQPATPAYTCLPTCSATDGRFLVVAGAGLGSLVDNGLTFAISVPAGVASFEIGIFDPDTGGRWDHSTFGAARGLELEVLADPGRGVGERQRKRSQVLDETVNGYDNAWYTAILETGDDARRPDGSFGYLLELRSPAPGAPVISCFKVRSTGAISLPPQPFALVAPQFSQADIEAHAAAGAAGFDGTFDLYFSVPEGAQRVEVWDGDFDFGSADCDPASQDDDDADTPNGPPPPWAAASGAVAEGRAVGTVLPCGATTGAPNDDGSSPLVRRPPAITYELLDPAFASSNEPGLHRFANKNPSGNGEWERFVVPGEGPRPPGTWHLAVHGADVGNQAVFYIPFDVLCLTSAVDAAGKPVPCSVR